MGDPTYNPLKKVERDPFGLNREGRIIKSGVRQIFTPHQPIQSTELFFGRTREVRALIEHLSTPGQHALLYGDRGVGKSSLANITSDLILKQISGGRFWQKRCDSTDTFSTLFLEPLADCGIDTSVLETESTKSEGGNAGAKIPVFHAEIESSSTEKTVRRGAREFAGSPGWVAHTLSSLGGLMLIDEIDALEKESERRKLAELIKHLSDSGSNLKLLVVGIADTGTDLTSGHPSVGRCLKETKLNRMSNQELREILVSGESKLGIQFSEKAKSRIIKVSSGYAHFTHLLALKSAEDAIGQGRTEINDTHVEAATSRAVNDAEGTLKRTYDDATRSSGTEEYKKILCAAAQATQEEITAANLRQEYKKLWQQDMTQASLNNYLSRLVSDGNHSILRRIAKGVYRFNDPRMPSYIKISNIDVLRDSTDI